MGQAELGARSGMSSLCVTSGLWLGKLGTLPRACCAHSQARAGAHGWLGENGAAAKGGQMVESEPEDRAQDQPQPVGIARISGLSC